MHAVEAMYSLHIATTKQKIIISNIRTNCPLKSSYVAPRVKVINIHCVVCFLYLLLELSLIYTASEVEHHPNIISKMCFIYDFLQKKNQFVIFCYQRLSLESAILVYTLKSVIADPRVF